MGEIHALQGCCHADVEELVYGSSEADAIVKQDGTCAWIRVTGDVQELSGSATLENPLLVTHHSPLTETHRQVSILHICGRRGSCRYCETE